VKKQKNFNHKKDTKEHEVGTLKSTPIWDRQCKSFRTLVKGEGEGW